LRRHHDSVEEFTFTCICIPDKPISGRWNNHGRLGRKDVRGYNVSKEKAMGQNNLDVSGKLIAAFT
jgi:hypothetical protein